MPVVAEISAASPSTLLLALGVAALYIASRAAADALVPGHAAADSAGRLAVGHWAPVAATAWVAVARGRPEIALGVVFGTSVAAMSLAIGLVTYLSPPTALPASRRVWPLVLPAALVPLIAGFSGHLSAGNALLMGVLGAAVFSAWRGAMVQPMTAAAPAAASPNPLPQTPPGGGCDEGLSPIGLDYATLPPKRRSVSLPDRAQAMRAAQWLLAIALAILGAKAALLGTVRADAESRLLRAGLLASAALSPALLLPMLATGSDLAQRGRSADAVAALVALTLLNLLALLPIVVLLWYVRSAAPNGGGLFAALLNAPRQGRPIPMPVTVWRIDAVLLTVLGLGLVPMALGRWAIGRLESIGLVIVYAAYLAAVAAAAARAG